MISENQKQEIIKLRKEGLGLLEISIQLKIGLASVALWCKRMDPEGKYNLNNNFDPENKEILISKYFELNKNLKKTAEFFKLNSRVIRYNLIKFNVYQGRKEETPAEKSRRKSKHVISWKKDKKIKLIEYKGGKCWKCGYDKCNNALDFHHINSDEKSFSISSNSFSFAKMKAEADKCVLLCANCHREFHAGLFKIDL